MSNPSCSIGDLMSDELQPTAWALVIEQDAITTEHCVRFAIVYAQLKSCALANAVRATRMKRRTFALWSFPHFAEHLARPSEVKLTLRLKFPQRGQEIMRSVDIGRHGRETVRKAFCHETLRCQMIAFIELMFGKDVEYTRVALQAGGMDLD